MTFLTINSLGSAGDGTATAPDGVVWHIPYTLPGEQITANPMGKPRDGHQRGRATQWHRRSPDRIDAPCQHFEICGGCVLQHLSPESYHSFKIERVQKNLNRARITVGMWHDPVFVGPQSRRRMTMAAIKRNTDLKLGYHEYKSKWIRDIDSCLVVTPLLNDIAKRLRPHLLRILPDNIPVDLFVQQGDRALELIITGGPVGNRTISKADMAQRIADMADDLDMARVGRRDDTLAPIEPLLIRGPLVKHFGPLAVDLPWWAFLQPCQNGEDALVQAVQRCLNPLPARMADLFCGSGTFTGALLAAGVRDVRSYDATPNAVTALAAATNGRAFIRNLFSNPLSVQELSEFDAVLLDPPRAGAKEQIEHLARSSLGQIVYISCNPATFARDAAQLQNADWHAHSIQIIDQFYGSSHVELVAHFTRER